MRLSTAICIAVAVIFFRNSATAQQENHGCISEQGLKLIEECGNANDYRRFELLRDKGRELSRLGAANSCEAERLAGEAYAVKGMVHLRDTTNVTVSIVKFTDKIESLANAKEYRLACLLANTVSLYHHFVNSDYSEASLYSFKDLQMARAASDRLEEINALSRLSSIYFSKGDMSGINYALNAYRMASDLKAYPQLYVASCNLANYYFNDHKMDRALEYLNESADLVRRLGLESETAYIKAFFGDIHNAQGEPGEAEKFYKEAVSDPAGTSNYDKVYARICYAIFLSQQHRIDDSRALFLESLDMSDKYRVDVFLPMILSNLSNLYEASGDYKEALRYANEYISAYRKVTTQEKEREFTILDLRNKISEEKSLNAAQQLKIMNYSRAVFVAGSLLLLLIIAVVFLLLFHHRKNRHNKETVRRYLESLEAEKKLRMQLENALAKKYDGTASIPDNRQTALFTSLQALMEQEHAYRDSSLSLEKAAEMLSTNRTYLSQIVNEVANQSFPAYVNSFRIREAISLLSDTENDEPLKNISQSVGFSTPSTFYTLFRQKTGMSPSVFRDNVRKIKQD